MFVRIYCRAAFQFMKAQHKFINIYIYYLTFEMDFLFALLILKHFLCLDKYKLHFLYMQIRRYTYIMARKVIDYWKQWLLLVYMYECLLRQTKEILFACEILYLMQAAGQVAPEKFTFCGGSNAARYKQKSAHVPRKISTPRRHNSI